jgi:F-type H+-transporting ATPase subunit b
MNMKRSIHVLLLVVVLVASLAGFAAAAEGGEHGSSVMTWVWKFVNFAILVIVLVVFLRKPMTAYFKTRTELIEKSIKEASEAKALAEKALKEIEERLKLKDQEIEKIINTAMKAGEVEKGSLIEEGHKMSEKIMEQAKSNIAYELKKAKEQLKADASQLAIELAEKKLSQKLTEQDQLKILEESLKKLEG